VINLNCRRVFALLTTAVLCSPALTAQQPAQEQEQPAPKPVPMPVPRALAAHRDDHQIVIDGVLQDWPNSPALLLDDPRQVSGTAMGAWRGTADLAARAFLLWDEDYLYFAAVVRDDWHRTLSQDSPRLLEIPPADNLIISFDPRRDTRAIGADDGRREDREFWLADVEGQGRRVVLWDRYRGTARFVDSCQAAVKHESERGLTTYEARFAWREILPVGSTPTEGAVYDLQIVINDYDEITDLIPQTRVGWTFGTGVRIDPGVYGSVMLVGPVTQAVAELPEFPPPAALSGAPVPDQAYWVRWWEQLQKTPPAWYRGDSGPPEDAGGIARTERLHELDHHLASFPRVDFLEYHERVHRRMRRELEGMVRTGVPFLWKYLQDDVRRRAQHPPKKGLRVFRLPVGGWLLRGAKASVAIDPAGYAIELGEWWPVWQDTGVVVLTDPRQLSKRSDQLLLRRTARKLAWFTHLELPLPAVRAGEVPVRVVGETYDVDGIAVQVVGDREGDLVSATAAYVITLPSGALIVHSSSTVSADALVAALPANRRVDVLFVSARHPQARLLTQRLAPRFAILDDVLTCATAAGPNGRVSLDDAYGLQSGLRPVPSIIVAPGESVDIDVAN